MGSEVLLTVEEILLTDTRQSTGNSLHPFVGIQRGRVKSQFSNLLHVKKSDSRAINKTIHKNQTNNTVIKYKKRKRAVHRVYGKHCRLTFLLLLPLSNLFH